MTGSISNYPRSKFHNFQYCSQIKVVNKEQGAKYSMYTTVFQGIIYN